MKLSIFRTITSLIALSGVLVTSMPSAFAQLTVQQQAIPRQVDRMYIKGLDYLLKNQKADGSFKGSYGNEVATYAFCIMSALAYGEDPEVGAYANMIKKCLNNILKNQQENGYFGNSMYSHGFATLALSELYGMLPDERIGKALSKAVDLTLTAQKTNKIGAWRYSPDAVNDGDTSIVGCQFVSLIAARNAGIPVPDASYEDAIKFLEKCYCNKGGFDYTESYGNSTGSVTLSAVGLLCMALYKDKTNKMYQPTLNLLKDNLNYKNTSYPYYFEYYMAQALFQADLPTWEIWNQKNIKLMEATQKPNGSWGDAYTTAFGLLSLALNYRFLPIYEK